MKYFGGCDVGSTYTKCVILDEAGKMVSDVTIRSRINSEISAKEALDQAVAKDVYKRQLLYGVLFHYGGRRPVPGKRRGNTENRCSHCHWHCAGAGIAGGFVPAVGVQVAKDTVKSCFAEVLQKNGMTIGSCRF